MEHLNILAEENFEETLLAFFNYISFWLYSSMIGG